MTKQSFAVFILFMVGLWVNGVCAEPVASPNNPAAAVTAIDSMVEPETPITPISSRKFNFDLPFVLQQEHKACLDKCSREHSACMSKAGTNPTAINNCDEQRWRCTLGCDDKYYGAHPADALNRY